MLTTSVPTLKEERVLLPNQVTSSLIKGVPNQPAAEIGSVPAPRPPTHSAPFGLPACVDCAGHATHFSNL